VFVYKLVLSFVNSAHCHRENPGYVLNNSALAKYACDHSLLRSSFHPFVYHRVNALSTDPPSYHHRLIPSSPVPSKPHAHAQAASTSSTHLLALSLLRVLNKRELAPQLAETLDVLAQQGE
jgi:hypothetical protein